ncbi:hypothetical protein CYY_005913 [Polysphondylium violaceum]|uniref:Nuclear pore complex protein n=1 Tax=Polysphondylium violaceum TaxID=133409 RepID=A0A8J4V3P1_9MYCE|nr:hypothetical protein CYY_005913 [Polysphondylium violaceum]
MSNRLFQWNDEDDNLSSSFNNVNNNNNNSSSIFPKSTSLFNNNNNSNYNIDFLPNDQDDDLMMMNDNKPLGINRVNSSRQFDDMMDSDIFNNTNDNQMQYNIDNSQQQEQQPQSQPQPQQVEFDYENIFNEKNKTDDFIYHYTLESVDLQTGNESKENIPIHLALNFLKLSQSKINSLKNELEQSYYLPNKKQIENNMHLYEFEKDTWDILSKLYIYRDIEKEKDRQESIVLQMQPSQTEVFNYLMKKNFEIRENSIIIQWLEEMASHIELNLDPVYWDHTLQDLKNKNKKTTAGKTTGNLVTELDADASSRQNVSIDKEDEKNQAKFLSTLWAFLRAGNKEGAIEFCVTVGQYWRAQTLLGFNYYDNETNIGNPYFNLWKSNCLDLSNKSQDLYERAVYGVMSGNLNSILQVSKNWYDYLWGYLKVLFDERIYQELKPYRSALSVEEDIEHLAPSSNLSQIHTPRDIINLLKTASPQDIKNQSKNPYHIIQQMIINDDYRALFDTCAQLISKTHQPIEFTRFAVMLILFFRKRQCYQDDIENGLDTGADDENSSENVIIHEYVKHLIGTQQHELVALYTSLFNSEKLRITVYSKFLETITDQATRQQCLGLAEQFNLNTQEIAQSVVKNITGSVSASIAESSSNNNNNAISSSATTLEDSTKIDSIKWLCFDKQLLIKAILSSNLLIREFIKSNKYNASSDLLKSLPKDIVAIAKQSSPLDEQDTNNIIKEFKDWENYLSANNRMNTWLQNYANQPKENLLSFKLSGKETYAQKLDIERRKKDYEEAFGQWNQNNIIHGQEAIAAINTVLGSGWLCPMENPVGEFDDDDENGIEINEIRKRCIPSLFKSLHTVLIGTDQMAKSSRLCNKIADERFKWFNVFTKSELQEILFLVRESSIKMLSSSF